MDASNLHFANDPIQEAAIQIEIKDLPAEYLPDIELLAASLQAQYPAQEKMRKGEFTFTFGGDPSSRETQLGHMLKSSDGRQIRQYRLNGFTFSRLAPYDRWEVFFPAAKNGWEIFNRTINNLVITKYSLRYINKLPIPPGEDIKDYLLTYPEVAPGMPQMFSNLYLRMDFPLRDQGTLTMQQIVFPFQNQGEVGYILDFDYQFPAAELSSDEVWTRIDALRPLKNEYFLASISPKMKEKLL